MKNLLRRLPLNQSASITPSKKSARHTNTTLGRSAVMNSHPNPLLRLLMELKAFARHCKQ
jgi:hypothetical protein